MKVFTAFFFGLTDKTQTTGKAYRPLHKQTEKTREKWFFHHLFSSVEKSARKNLVVSSSALN